MDRPLYLTCPLVLHSPLPLPGAPTAGRPFQGRGLPLPLPHLPASSAARGCGPRSRERSAAEAAAAEEGLISGWRKETRPREDEAI